MAPKPRNKKVNMGKRATASSSRSKLKRPKFTEASFKPENLMETFNTLCEITREECMESRARFDDSHASALAFFEKDVKEVEEVYDEVKEGKSFQETVLECAEAYYEVETMHKTALARCPDHAAHASIEAHEEALQRLGRGKRRWDNRMKKDDLVAMMLQPERAAELCVLTREECLPNVGTVAEEFDDIITSARTYDTETKELVEDIDLELVFYPGAGTKRRKTRAEGEAEIWEMSRKMLQEDIEHVQECVDRLPTTILTGGTWDQQAAHWDAQLWVFEQRWALSDAEKAYSKVKAPSDKARQRLRETWAKWEKEWAPTWRELVERAHETEDGLSVRDPI
jgi:hypothetical protein